MYPLTRAGAANLAAGLAVAALSLVALCLGRVPLPAQDVLAAMGNAMGGNFAVPHEVEQVLWQLRAPRIAAALLVGAALSAAGAAYQGMFRNPLVSPDLLGVSAGAALGAALGLFLSQHALAIQLAAFAGGLAAVALVYAIGSSARHHDPVVALILAGVVVGTLLGSLTSLLKVLADPHNELPAITFWLLGGLAGVSPRDLAFAAPLVLASLIPLVLLRWRMNLLSLPEDEAASLGVPVARLRAVVIVAATLMTASTVAISGVIGWIGLLIPHAARLLVGPEFSRLLPLSMLIGAAFLLAVDTLGRTVAPIEIPPGVLTALIGAPFFLWLFATGRRAWQ